MNNVSGGGIKDGILQPGIILNAVIDPENRVVQRDGYSLHIAIDGCHSLFAGTFVVLCVGDTRQLYKVDLTAKTKTALTTITSNHRVYYAEVGDSVYMSSKNWNGVYDFSTDSVRDWGEIIDTMDALNWVRETNGNKYFLADYSGNPTAAMKPHDFVHKPDPMEYIVYGHGRIWGSRNKTVYYSDAVSPEWFQDDVNNLQFNDVVRMIAVSSGGIYVGFDNYTVFLAGTNPDEMQYVPKKTGAIPHTVQYARGFGELGNNIPVWGTPSGQVMAGMPDGNLMDLTKGNIRFDVSEGVGSSFRIINGEPQYLMTFTLPEERVAGDETTHEWVTET